MTCVIVPPEITTVAGSGEVLVTGVPDAGTDGVANPLPWSMTGPVVGPLSVRSPEVSC